MSRTAFVRFAIVPALGASLFTSCSTDINLLEDYKPITIVYGLLNVNDSVQYIKVNKAFLGEGNALVMAQQSDSINYQPNDLDVRLQRINALTGEVLQETICGDTTGIAKESGIFSNPYQLLYYSRNPIDENSNYKLLINRHIDGAVITAVTPIVHTVSVTNPDPQSPGSQVFFVNNSLTYVTYYLRWKHAANAQIYAASLRFTYYDSLLVAPFTKDTVVLEMNAGEVSAGDDPVGRDEQLAISGQGVFGFIQSSVQPSSNSTRFADEYIEIFLSAGAEDLETYINVNKPSLGIIQEKPVFSNINNGTGIFSSRWTTRIKAKMTSFTVTKANQVLN